MTLRRRLVLLLGLFAAYAVAAAVVTIYGSQWRVESAVKRFERLASGTSLLERMQLLLSQQQLQLGQLVAGSGEPLRTFMAARDEYVSGIQNITTFAPSFISHDAWTQILRQTEALEEESNRCLAALNDGNREQAAAILASRINAELLPSLRTNINTARGKLDEARNQSARDLATTSTQILTLTTTVALLAVGLVVIGSMFMRRWLFRPIAELHEATRRFSEGDLSARATRHAPDELGALADALNKMAASVAASERKYRTLFSNLRDAVIICDREARIVEYHDSETQLLAVDEGVHVGKRIAEVWPEWQPAAEVWPGAVRAAADEGRRYQEVDVRLNADAQEPSARIADIFIYRVEYGDTPCAAIVLRDATERHRLQDRLRRAGTMEAVGTMAGGLAHDVNNLLTSVSATLSSIAAEETDSDHRERIESALRTLRRAAGLAKRLLNFASGAQGNPQIFAPGPIVETILESMESASLKDIRTTKRIDHGLHVRMDPDQFAQIVLNLVKNACDAMPAGGTLAVTLGSVQARHPETGSNEREHVLLEVTDNGTGMTADIRNRVFEPFFTTKSREPGRGRGMGLAVVYTAVQTAGGFLKVLSQPGSGTTFQVFLPKQPHDGFHAVSDIGETAPTWS